MYIIIIIYHNIILYKASIVKVCLWALSNYDGISHIFLKFTICINQTIIRLLVKIISRL